MIRNKIILACKVTEQAKAIDESNDIYEMEVVSERKSKVEDIAKVRFKNKEGLAGKLTEGTLLLIKGKVLSENVEDKKALIKVNIFIEAKEITFIEDMQALTNKVLLYGRLSKNPVVRKTKSGKEIADIILVVGSGNNKSFIPCIFWGDTAHLVGRLEKGDCIGFKGRYQSRQYKKQVEDGQYITLTAFEVSGLMGEVECQ